MEMNKHTQAAFDDVAGYDLSEFTIIKAIRAFLESVLDSDLQDVIRSIEAALAEMGYEKDPNSTEAEYNRVGKLIANAAIKHLITLTETQNDR